MKKLIILVPYRRREQHLARFLPHMQGYFRGWPRPWHIVVVEQSGDGIFNRGKLLNAGFDRYRGERAYFCFHDVDYLPQRVPATRRRVYGPPGRGPIHLVRERLATGGQKIVENRNRNHELFCGVCIFSARDFQRVNGFGNNFLGWGFEDDDILRRAESVRLPFSRRGGVFSMLPHEPQPHQEYCSRTNWAYMMSGYDKGRDGLSSLRYKVRDEFVHSFWSHLVVDISER